MKATLATAALIAACSSFNCTSALSQEHVRLLSYGQRQAYNACLTSAWVGDFCRGHSWGIFASYDITYAACVEADTRRNAAAPNPYLTPEEYCWQRARRVRR